MTTHSSILAWEIPWTEEPGGLQFHSVSRESDTTEATQHACTHDGHVKSQNSEAADAITEIGSLEGEALEDQVNDSINKITGGQIYDMKCPTRH